MKNRLKDQLMSAEAKQALGELLWHNPDDGQFYWKVDHGRKTKRGTVAGHRTDQGVFISVKGVLYPAHRIAWLFAYGTWPRSVRHMDGDKTNNRIENLC